MGKLKVSVIAMMLMAVTSVNAAWRVVIDPWTTAQVTANTTAQVSSKTSTTQGWIQ